MTFSKPPSEKSIFSTPLPHARLSQEETFCEGHLSISALTLLSSGHETFVPTEASVHLNECTECTDALSSSFEASAASSYLALSPEFQTSAKLAVSPLAKEPEHHPFPFLLFFGALFLLVSAEVPSLLRFPKVLSLLKAISLQETLKHLFLLVKLLHFTSQSMLLQTLQTLVFLLVAFLLIRTFYKVHPSPSSLA